MFVYILFLTAFTSTSFAFAPGLSYHSRSKLFYDEDIDVSSESTTHSTGHRILNGEIAEEKTFPYMVSLQIRMIGSTGKFCGGVIIQPNWILTAAHCYYDEIEDSENFRSDYWIKAGSVDAYLDEDESQSRRVIKIITHPKYEPDIAIYDIALVKLDRSLKYTDNVQPIALPPAKYKAKGTGTILGWGTIDQRESIPSRVLRYATLSVSNRNECRRYFGYIRMDQICLGYGSKQSACAGDSGGPFVQDINGDPVVVAILSYATRGCNENDPSVYSNVASYLGWISKTISEY